MRSLAVPGTHVTRTGDESVARPQPERSKSSSCTKSATVCLRAPKFVRRRYSSRTDTQILPTFLHVDSTHLQVRRVVTTVSGSPKISEFIKSNFVYNKGFLMKIRTLKRHILTSKIKNTE